MTGKDTPIYEEWTQVALSPDVNLVPRAVDTLRTALASQGAPPDAVDAVRLGVTEALTNAILHGCCPPGSAEIRLRWNWTNEWLVVEVSEPGHFSPSARWTDLPEDPFAESGRGGNLIQGQFDDFIHSNSHGRHTLRMRKRLGPQWLSPAVAAELEKTLAAMTEDLSASYETLSALFRLAEALATGEDMPSFVKRILELRSLTEADAIQIRLRDSSGKLVVQGRDGAGLPAGSALEVDSPALEAEVFRTGVERSLEKPRASAAGDPLATFDGVAFVCPIHFQSRTLGVCVLARCGARPFFTAGQVSLARTTAEFLGIACANAELQAQRTIQLRAQRELEIAAQIQQSLVPAVFPVRGDWRVYGAGHNAYEAGGDFFDVIEVDGGVLLVIADVMGKGMAAALLAVVLRTAVRAHAAHAGTPGELLNCVNVQISGDLERVGMFITAQAVFLPGGGADLAYASAGHCPIAVLGPTPGLDRFLEEGGLPLGVSQQERYATFRVPIAPGERILLSTDGVLEITDEAGRELGLVGLVRLARELTVKDPAGLCQQVLSTLARRDGQRSATDDRTLLAIERMS